MQLKLKKFKYRDNRSTWKDDYLYTEVKDGDNIYNVVYYIRFYPVHETYPEKFNYPRVEISYYREDSFYFAMDVLNPHINKIHKIVENHYNQKYDDVQYDLVYHHNYREIFFT